MRTFVSFEADFPIEDLPAGREVAEFIAQALHSTGLSVTGPTNRENWAWEIHSTTDKRAIHSIIGFSDDGPRQWQIHTYLTKPLFQRLFGNAAADQEQLRTYCRTIDSAIKNDPRFRTIRWYEQAVFEKDHGDTWGDGP